MKKEKRGRSFGKISEKYDRYRPVYPKKVMEDIIKIAGLENSDSILDIGSGTGKGCWYFAERGYSLTCIEPDKKLISTAKKKHNFKNTKFINTSFENSDLKNKKFPLITSAQAFHWVDFDTGVKKIYNHLTSDGVFAFFWNITDFDSSKILKKVSSIISRYYGKEPPKKPEFYEIYDKLKKSQYFKNVRRKKYISYTNYTKKEFLEMLKTFSLVISLSENSRKKLFEDLDVTLSGRAKKVKIKTETLLVVGKKNN